MNNRSNDAVGVVIIGRNEGERLQRCIASVSGGDRTVVYVDSGSTDGSLQYAREHGVHVVELNTSIPFTAGRARNEGFQRLETVAPELEFVQFVDGDCEVAANWIHAALQHLHEHPEAAIVCGRLKERFPEATIYNALCDVEWDTVVGEVHSSGGIFMCRSKVFRKAGGFNPQVIAGEEPELCFRLRQQDWKIVRIPELMALHDANMTRASQWWKRAKRCGYAYAHGMDLHGRTRERMNVRKVASVLAWGLGIPLAWMSSVLAGQYWLTAVISVLPFMLFANVLRHYKGRRGLAWRLAFPYSASVVLGKLPQALGVVQYFVRKFSKRQHKIIEYK